MASLIIKGQPIAAFEFDALPSWNEAIAAARGRGGHWTGSSHTKKWRRIGEKLAQGWLEWCGIAVPRKYLVNRAMVVVKVFRPNKIVVDVHNVYVKAILDGFTDASIWRDDNYRHVPWVLFGFVPQDDLETALVGKAFLIEVYPLDYVEIDGVDHTPQEQSTEYGKTKPKRGARVGMARQPRRP